ncbi:M23 family metallopeptidase [Sansalvadorimonas sp. 2012CJ34-2]|uniref:M23 family metallopeptidase n=1 Tax=Parendozoicomonas callyspongiae TaxID=2942213 RepID=A0ABT0PBQ9_9GAMM|nr:M23 family metallopeptidase [Sansalvadorimonas sp. 2012CJ34-2]MCL6268718.1 M23 family metallopeptidase [Sansalvadorimonas sp. 2012CJ34-2]
MTKAGCLLMTLLLALPIHANTPIKQNLFSGEALFLTLPQQLQGCQLMYKNRKYPVYPHPIHDHLSVVVLVAELDSKDANQKVMVQCKKGNQNDSLIDIRLIEPNYPVEPLSVNPDLVTPPEHARQRIDKERAEIRSALTCKLTDKPLESAFTLPVPLRKVTSPFGIRRLYNGQLKSRHTGVDFRAATGTPVCAPHDGAVRMAQDNWYTGGHIVLEHGWGVTSSYFHLSELQVKVGDKVRLGQQIALSGATGRVTGPHLHWGIHVNGTPVNPMQFVRDSMELFSGL